MKSQSIIKLSLALLVGAYFTGCTTNTCDPSRMSFVEIASGKGARCIDVQSKHNDSLVLQLQQMKKQSTSLESKAISLDRRLKNLRSRTSTSTAADIANREALKKKQAELQKVKDEISNLQSELATKQSLNRDETQQYQNQISKLNDEIDLLNKTIDRIMQIRREHGDRIE